MFGADTCTVAYVFDSGVTECLVDKGIWHECFFFFFVPNIVGMASMF